MNTKILIVDDEIDIVLMLRSFFESKGYLVLFATNGEEALKQIERQPNIILLDINMPGLDGLEVCERIRNYISCPILFLTARIEDTDKVRGFAAGGDDYVVHVHVDVEALVIAFQFAAQRQQAFRGAVLENLAVEVAHRVKSDFRSGYVGLSDVQAVHFYAACYGFVGQRHKFAYGGGRHYAAALRYTWHVR